jgi:hypothetical protein
MARARKKRVSLSLRLQPYDGDPMAEVVDYLNSLPKDEVNRKVADILVAALLPLARYHNGNYTPSQLRFACWESQDSLNKHGSNTRFALGVEQPQFVLPQQAMLQSTMGANDSIKVNNGKTIQDDLEDKLTQKVRPNSLVKGKASSDDLDNIFGD